MFLSAGPVFLVPEGLPCDVSFVRNATEVGYLDATAFAVVLDANRSSVSVAHRCVEVASRCSVHACRSSRRVGISKRMGPVACFVWSSRVATGTSSGCSISVPMTSFPTSRIVPVLRPHMFPDVAFMLLTDTPDGLVVSLPRVVRYFGLVIDLHPSSISR